MAGGENYTKWTISQVSRADGVSLDQYYWLQNSFQYAENVNTDDEMHGVKLAQKMSDSSSLANCQLVSAGETVFSLNMSTWEVRRFNENNWSSWGSQTWPTLVIWNVNGTSVAPGVVFQNYFRYWVNSPIGWWVVKIPLWTGTQQIIAPQDHPTEADDDIMNPDSAWIAMKSWVTAILNYNNSRLVVACGEELRVYYPELENEYNRLHPTAQQKTGKVWWKRVQTYEEGSFIIALTCTFEYLKVWVQDEWWNTKVYYYQGNNNLKSTYVYNVIDLTGTKVLRVYSINSLDYYTASLDGSVNYITFNKMIGNVPVMILKQRAWLTEYDVNYKDPYFVWPSGMDAPYLGGAFYVADTYWIFKFQYDPQSYDKGYMKWKKQSQSAPAGVAISKNFLYVSDQNGIHRVRLYDTWVDWYQDKGILISRELEWEYGGCVTKMLDEVRIHYELLPEYQSSSGSGNWDIDIYVSPNNQWEYHDPTVNSTWWWHVMHIDQNNFRTRTEQINRFNSLQEGMPAFEFDWQTITYCIVINKGSTNQATPILREVNLRYQLKGKTNNIYWIQNN